MHPTLFEIPLPSFIANWLGVGSIVFYTYACCIVAGALLACVYIKKYCKKELGGFNVPNSFFYKAFAAGFVGGKLLFYLEQPSYYINHPQLMLNNFGGGFVCYGSVLFIIAYGVFYSRKNKINPLGFLDILAIACSIPIALGRVGCFFGGCCYGKPTHSLFGVVFPNATPVAVHPTQLYEASMMLFIIACSLLMKKYKTNAGQVFFVNMGLYAVGRFCLEFLRGDFRGTLFNGFLSHAQTIALCLFIISVSFFYKLYRNKNKLNTNIFSKGITPAELV
jgi:phosphatidylglycerol---prolipoprotein diacylglyceryl transferase